MRGSPGAGGAARAQGQRLNPRWAEGESLAKGPGDLVGAWQHVEDRTPAEQKRDPRERPPLGARFRVALEGETVLVEHTRRDALVKVAIAPGGKETSQPEGERVRSFSGRFEGGSLHFQERTASKGADGTLTTSTITDYTLTLTSEGLLVRMAWARPTPLERRALYKSVPDVPPAKPVPGDLKALAWLVGRFTGTQGKAEIEEHWGPAGGGAMLGTARTVAGGKMVGFEFLRIVAREGSLVYVAQPGGGPAVEFVLTELSPTRALFENPQHDYPKRILYVHLASEQGGVDGLRTEISDTGGARAHTATFQRAK